MDDLLDKFNNLNIEKVNEEEINELNMMIDGFKTKICSIGGDGYRDEWDRFFKNYKKISNLSNILKAFKSSPRWHSSLGRSFKIFLNVLDQLNQYYLDSIDFTTVDIDGQEPQLGNYWDRESARDTLLGIKGLLEESIKDTQVEEKITHIVDAYTLIMLLFEPVLDVKCVINKRSDSRIKNKLPKINLGATGGVKKNKRASNN